MWQTEAALSQYMEHKPSSLGDLTEKNVLINVTMHQEVKDFLIKVWMC